MITRLEGHVEKIKFIKKVGTSLDMCEIQIDFDTLIIFYDAGELMDFLNKDVTYTTRMDVVDGTTTQVICELAMLSTIQTVNSTENIKLIPEGTKRTVCNVDSTSLKYGEIYPNVVAYLSKYVIGSSAKAKWYDATLIDINSKEFEVRMFNASAGTTVGEAYMQACLGHYVNFDLESTKFGYQTKDFVALPNEVEESPEVIVAKQVVLDIINEDDGLRAYNEKYKLIDVLRGIIDGEPGYALVRIASEIYMINAVDNISTDLDIKAMKRAAICSRGYLIPHTIEWSRPMLNTNKILQIPALKSDKELISILDVLTAETPSSTKRTYLKVRQLVDDIIKIRRSVVNEKDISTFADISSMFVGLL